MSKLLRNSLRLSGGLLERHFVAQLFKLLDASDAGPAQAGETRCSRSGATKG